MNPLPVHPPLHPSRRAQLPDQPVPVGLRGFLSTQRTKQHRQYLDDLFVFHKGGALETIREGLTGAFFDTQTEEALAAAVAQAAGRAWDSRAIRAHAEQFGVQRFLDGLAASIERCLTDSR